jgi:hypothetical protein
LIIGLALPAADALENPRHDKRQRRNDGDRDHGEDDQVCIVVRKHEAERQHSADVVDKTGSQDDLAEFSAVVAGFDHYGVHYRDGRR